MCSSHFLKCAKTLLLIGNVAYPINLQKWTGSSTYSNGTSGHLSLSNITSAHTSPNRVSAASSQFGTTSHPADYPPTPSSLGPQSSPRFASSHQSQGLPSINQQYDAPRPSSDFPPQESRRSSIGSQMNNGMTNLQLNGTSSPYGSTNASQTSIALGLQQQRGITSMSNGIRNSRASGQTPMSPLGPNAGEPRSYYPKTAPIISANPVREVYNAEQPTTGQPYAFPDPDMDRSSGSGEEPRSTSAMFSRRDSGHTSITSSIITSDSRLPPGQHRLDDGSSTWCRKYVFMTNPGSDMPGTHHHSLQHRQVSSLVGDPESPDGVSPYSRTPALRVSHKLAERKRRSEMKDLFEALRLQIPSHQGAKSSKWEILTKGKHLLSPRLISFSRNQNGRMKSLLFQHRTISNSSKVSSSIASILRSNWSARVMTSRLHVANTIAYSPKISGWSKNFNDISNHNRCTSRRRRRRSITFPPFICLLTGRFRRLRTAFLLPRQCRVFSTQTIVARGLFLIRMPWLAEHRSFPASHCELLAQNLPSSPCQSRTCSKISELYQLALLYPAQPESATLLHLHCLYQTRFFSLSPGAHRISSHSISFFMTAPMSLQNYLHTTSTTPTGRE